MIEMICLFLGVCKTHRQHLKAALVSEIVQPSPEKPNTTEGGPSLVQTTFPCTERQVVGNCGSGSVQIDPISSERTNHDHPKPERPGGQDIKPGSTLIAHEEPESARYGLDQTEPLSTIHHSVPTNPGEGHTRVVQSGDLEVQTGGFVFTCSDTENVQTAPIELKKKSSDCSISRTESESGNSHLTDCDSQEMSLSQTSNWSTSSENLSNKLKAKTDNKAREILKVSNLLKSLGFTFPSSLVGGIDPKVKVELEPNNQSVNIDNDFQTSSKVLNQQLTDIAHIFSLLSGVLCVDLDEIEK